MKEKKSFPNDWKRPLTEEEIKNMKTFSERYWSFHPYDPIKYFANYPERKLDPEQKYFESLERTSILCYDDMVYDCIHDSLVDKFPEFDKWGDKESLFEYINNNKERIIEVIKKQIKDLQNSSQETTSSSTRDMVSSVEQGMHESAENTTVSSNRAIVEPKRIKITLEELNSRIGIINRCMCHLSAFCRIYRDLELVFDYDKLNELGQSIMLIEKDELEDTILAPKIIEKDERLKQLVHNCCKDNGDGYRKCCNLILWSLIILCVDTTDFNKKLSIICDLAQAIWIDEGSIQEIIRIVQNVYKMDNQIDSKLDKKALKIVTNNVKRCRQRYLYKLYNDIDFRLNN